MTPSTVRRDAASRLIKASPAAIYQAFVVREAMAKWSAPEGATMAIQVFEPRIGGRIQMTFTFASAPGKSTANAEVVVGSFVALVPQQRIVQMFECTSTDPTFAGMMTMPWVLEVAAGGTVVTVVAENVPSGISQTDHGIGMNSSLAHLAAYVQRVVAVAIGSASIRGCMGTLPTLLPPVTIPGRAPLA
ncbi:SRPBCC domain-containing protein [Cupriavidus basilensis]|uniref:SRPBCC domain-containing protein n=1 Tax=Cupriavidus basilensis TaxID=68895 RepID=A0ABT6AKV0_9BURK|nr:SRPBCC domain-containing protein [Cupriavidus basilensis]MDF3833242.1 SRPBCC domain-containing protein [Cupriavidus basilensis]